MNRCHWELLTILTLIAVLFKPTPVTRTNPEPPALSVLRWTTGQYLFELRGTRWTAELRVPGDEGWCVDRPARAYLAHGTLSDEEQVDFWAGLLCSAPWGSRPHSQSRVEVTIFGSQRDTEVEPGCRTDQWLESSLAGRTRRALVVRRDSGEPADYNMIERP